jgi:amino acid transporter
MTTGTVRHQELRAGAVGTVVSTVFALASTAPAYSLAVTVGLLAALVGGWATPVLVVSAIPVALVVLSFAELNAAEPDCGTCFAWVTRAFGSIVGWLAGWVTIAASVLSICNLVQVAAIYAYTILGAPDLAESRLAQAVLGLVLLAALSYLAHLGITVAARTQLILFGAELVALLAVIVAALVTTPLPDDAPAAAGTPSIGSLAAAVLVAVFLYWGWDSSFSVNEESTEPAATPGRSALLAMGLLVLLYGGFTAAVSAWAGVHRLAAVGEDDLFATLGTNLLGTAGGTLLAGAVMVSALAGAQTTLLPAARSAFSMARRDALPSRLAGVSRRGGPSVATWSLAGLSGAVYLGLVLTSEAVLADSVAATGVLVSAYYGITCLAVPFALGRSARARPVRRIVVPMLAAVMFAVVLVAAAADLATTSVFAVLVTTGIGVAVLTVHSRLKENHVRSENRHG